MYNEHLRADVEDRTHTVTKYLMGRLGGKLGSLVPVCSYQWKAGVSLRVSRGIVVNRSRDRRLGDINYKLVVLVVDRIDQLRTTT
jgi:hypothetical protein